MDRRLDLRLVALATAYAVALSALLPFLAVLWAPATAGESLAVICSAGGSAPDGSPQGGLPSDSGAPAKSHPLCPGGGACAMAGCAAAVLPEVGAHGAAVRVSIGLLDCGPESAPSPRFRPSGRLARGPPIA